jgi:hypothetical protein
VERFIQLGSYYPQAAPALEVNNRYILTLLARCEAARAETCDGFAVISVNAPFMVGAVSGHRATSCSTPMSWANGKLDMPHFAPTGGTNFMSFRSLSQALEGALLAVYRKAYLVGDENLSYAAFFDQFFKAVGSKITIGGRDEAHPDAADAAIPARPRANWIPATSQTAPKQRFLGNAREARQQRHRRHCRTVWKHRCQRCLRTNSRPKDCGNLLRLAPTDATRACGEQRYLAGRLRTGGPSVSTSRAATAACAASTF